ncbi:MAG: GNAT family N-acetyltransferase [Eubacteriaceae bacterium]
MITKMNLKDFDAIYKIMEESFPQDEYRPYSEQKSLLDKENYTIYVFKDQGFDTIKGFITLWEFKSFSYIEHFAVNSKFRGSGIGSSILQEVMKKCETKICLEVELPEDIISEKRIHFYEDNHFFLNHYPYTQPPISTGRKSIPLLLMTYPEKISELDFIDIKKDLYRYVYNMK